MKSISSLKKNALYFSLLIAASGSALALHQNDHSDMSQAERVVATIEDGHLPAIQQLLNNGLDVNQDLDNDGTPLIIAVQNGHKRVVEFLLSHGADVNLESETDGNPLVAAALSNELELLTYLHKSGAEIDAITEYDETALISASRAGHFEIVKYLVEQGADVNLGVVAKVRKGTELRTPLNGAKTAQIRDFLVSHGARY